MNNEQKIEQFKANLGSVAERISAAAQRSGRAADSVTLVAVTKYVDAEVTELIIKAGAVVLGENRPQVLEEKTAALGQYPVQWHLIGHLQTNKVKKIIRQSALIHSVDSQRLVDTIEKQAVAGDLNVDVLLEVNVSGETAKHGVAPSELSELLTHCQSLKAVRVKGLMAMAGLESGDDQKRAQFALLRSLRDEHRKLECQSIQLDELSMGMSGDFEMAIEEGATLVRVGSSLYEGVD